MREAVIVSVARTPVAKMAKSLAAFPAMDIAGMAIKTAIERAGVAPEAIDEMVYANLFNYDNRNPARIAWLEAGLPDSVPSFTVDRQCSSSLNAVAVAAMLVSTGNCDVVLAGGIESYTHKPIMIQNPSTPFPSDLKIAIDQTTGPKLGNPPMIVTADNLARQYNISREECDAFALESHKKAAAAWAAGFYGEEVFPVHIPGKKGDTVFAQDECVRAETTLEALAKLAPIMKGGVTTAGNASPMNDGASAIVVMSAEKAGEYGLEPLARVSAFASAGCDPSIMGIGPVHATRKLMKKTGLRMEDFDIIEINEAFAAQTLAVMKELEIDPQKLNPNGGAIAIGHPNAASGGILTARTVRHMKKNGLKKGLISFCCGGGQGFSLVLERD